MSMHPIAHAATRPDHPAVIMTGSGQQMTYGEMEAESNRFAHLLRARGIGSGPEETLPDELLERLNISREKAEDVVNKVLEAESLLRELASQFTPH